MATIFVAKDGSDSNDGSTWALAKLTIQAAVNAAASTDTIQVGAGVYHESVTMARSTSFVLTIQAMGLVILDGGAVLTDGFTVAPSALVNHTLNLNDFIIKSFTGVGVVSGNGNVPVFVLTRCVIYDCGTGAKVGTSSSSNVAGTLNNCLIHHCTTGFTCGSSLSAQNTLKRCTIADCGTGIVRAGSGALTVSHCVLAGNGVHYSITSTAGGVITLDYNDAWFDGVSSATWGATTDITSFATWKSTSGKDANSISEDPVFVDQAKYLYGLHTTSGVPAQLKELAASAGAGHLYNPCVGFSQNDPDGLWANRILSNVVVNGSGNIELDSGQSVGYVRTGVIDLGRPRRIGRINPITNLATSMYPTDVPDYDIAESQPLKMTYRWRGSLSSFIDADVSPAWNEVEKSAQGYDVQQVLRYIQIEVTLRNNGV